MSIITRGFYKAAHDSVKFEKARWEMCCTLNRTKKNKSNIYSTIYKVFGVATLCVKDIATCLSFALEPDYILTLGRIRRRSFFKMS
jgi:hypothetical protein